MNDAPAVVIGAGMAGLTAAVVLSKRYPSVIVLDRDALPASVQPRSGVPQSSQLHILLASGLRELEELLPGYGVELLESGGTHVDLGSGLCTWRYGRRWPGVPIGVGFTSATRPQIESLVRARLAEFPTVKIRDGVSVSGLGFSPDLRVNGVVLNTGETIDAALVVDCSGRGSRSDRWLGEAGLPVPRKLEVKIGVSYATRFFHRRDGDLPGWQGILTQPVPPGENMIGAALPVENDRWGVLIGGWNMPDPPADPESFARCARALPDPALSSLLERVEPVTGIVTHRFPSSRRRLFEKLTAPPAGLVTMGDAMCSFNPIYGQGMTCAIHEALALGRALDRHEGSVSSAFVRDYYARAARFLDAPWSFAVGGDFGFPHTTGPKPLGTGLLNWYAGHVVRASQRDASVNRVFQNVQQLIAPPRALMRPAFVARVARASRGWSSAA